MISIVIPHTYGQIGNWVSHSKASCEHLNITHSFNRSHKMIKSVCFDMVSWKVFFFRLLHVWIRFLCLGAFETILVSWFTLFDAEQKLMLTPDFSAYMDRDFIKTIKTLGIIMLEIFDLGMKASHLRWTDSDIALFNALLLMNPGMTKFTALFFRLMNPFLHRTTRSVW